MKRLSGLLLMVCAAVGTPAGARAQATATLRGRVVFADSITPARGVVITVTDASDVVVARALTGDAGEYRALVPPGRYVIRALRIGLRPTVGPSVEPADGSTTDVPLIVLGTDAVRLDEVRVEGGTSCQIRADSARAVAGIWEQAKAVLGASTVSAGGTPYQSTLIRYQNYVPTGELRIARESTTVVRTSGSNGFISLHADSLAAEGYMVTSGVRSEFRAPDAAVLLSPTFAADHCFRIVAPPRARPEWIGVGFRPSTTRRGVVGIAGTFWLDRASAELRRLEFTYVNVPSTLRRDDAEGWVEFAPLSTGDWVVSRWVIRTPVNDPEARRGGAPAGMTTAGGITRSVFQGDAAIYTDVGPSVTLQITGSDTMNAVAGTQVAISGSSRAGYADASGRIEFSSLPPGRYRFQFWTPMMDWLNVGPVERDVEVTLEPNHVEQVRMPSAREVAMRVCRGGALVVGSVTKSDGSPWPNATLELFTTRTVRTSRNAERVAVTNVVRADQYGRWYTCGSADAMRVALRRGEVTGPKHSVLLSLSRTFARLDLSERELPP